ncbi:hypothetical protein HELRODRAFT_81825 [Helobdella robusta]|uniref:Phosducin domain-containing protein n=1 Tax=Helobdella robusta TaxID=6412 RepID=T1G4J2_HELRO|nr:hypothetical protein HELRODRAFT_81825 [Helobdella robusta]ESO01233.1 hypothetical protein HELRODRAFT_81825 [Helobdella robusta]
MALSFDDKILGEKTDYYCSSSEDEKYDSCDDDDNECGHSNQNHKSSSKSSTKMPTTGPKGVLEDWRRYKQLETERRDENEKERLALAKKLSTTCRTIAKDLEYLEEIEDHLDDFDEEFMKEYRAKRIESMRNAVVKCPQFGKVVHLNKQTFLEAIDKEDACTIVVVHIYKKGVTACETMNKCIDELSTAYPDVKFCKIETSHIQMSLNFSLAGVPALLVYKKGELVGNFVRLSDEFGDEFFPNDVASFLVELVSRYTRLRTYIHARTHTHVHSRTHLLTKTGMACYQITCTTAAEIRAFERALLNTATMTTTMTVTMI